MTPGFLTGCAVCFGNAHGGVQLVMLGMLLLPFVMVGGMMGLLYVKGAFATRPADPGNTSPAATSPKGR